MQLINWDLYVTPLKVMVTSLGGISIAPDDEDAMFAYRKGQTSIYIYVYKVQRCLTQIIDKMD